MTYKFVGIEDPTPAEIAQFHSIIQDLLNAQLHPSAWPDPRRTMALAAYMVRLDCAAPGAYRNGAILRHALVRDL